MKQLLLTLSAPHSLGVDRRMSIHVSTRLLSFSHFFFHLYNHIQGHGREDGLRAFGASSVLNNYEPVGVNRSTKHWA